MPGPGRSPRGGHGNPLQYSCLENLMDRGAWWFTVHRVTKSRTWLKWLRSLTETLTTGLALDMFLDFHLIDLFLEVSQFYGTVTIWDLPWWLRGKDSASQCKRRKRREFHPWVKRLPWSGRWQPIPLFLPGKFHAQRSLVGCCPWGRKESDTTEQLTTMSIYYLAGKTFSKVSRLSIIIYLPKWSFLYLFF